MIIDIIGGGIGGLTTGIALKQKGFSVRIFEQAKAVKPVGAGIILASNAMQVYQKLGLYHKILEKGNPVASICLVDASFDVLSDTNLTDFEKKYGVQNTAIHRAELQKVLLEEFTKEELFLDHELENIIKYDSSNYQLVFKNQKKYSSSMIIGADGIHSKVRALCFDKGVVRETNQLCWRGVLNYSLPQNYQHKAVESWGKGTRFGFVKIDENRVYWFALKLSDCKNNSLDNIAFEDFKEYNSLVTDMIVNTSNKNIHTSIIADLRPMSDWSKHSICLLGDAAHATTPNLGQGACQAIEDAYVLAACIDNNGTTAFKEFENLRIKKAHKVVAVSRKVGEMAHWSNAIAVAIRNRMLKIVPSTLNKKQLEFVFQLSDV